MNPAVEIVTTIVLLASSVLMIAVAATWFSGDRRTRPRPRSRKLDALLQAPAAEPERPAAQHGISWTTAAYVAAAGVAGLAIGIAVGRPTLEGVAGALVVGLLVPVLGGTSALYLAGPRRTTLPVVVTVALLVGLTALTVVIPA